METSLPSKKIVIVDLPDVKKIDALFCYNFFVKDERINTKGDISVSETIPNNFVDYNRRTPRYIALTWKPIVNNKRTDLINKISIEANAGKIIDEREFSTDAFSHIFFQDSGIDGRIAFFVQKAISNIGLHQNNDSILGHARNVNSSTHKGVTTEFLANGLNNPNALGVSFADNPNGVSLLTELKQVGLNTKINSKFLYQMLNEVQQDPSSPFSDEASSMLDKALIVSKQSQTTHDSSVFSVEDYETIVRDYITVKAINSQTYDPIIQPVGYIVEKWEIVDGTLVPLPPIYVENPNISYVADQQVKYGAKYTYKIKAVSYVETIAQDTEEKQQLILGFLVSSTPSPAVVVECFEYVAPPPPSDFKIVWDHQKECSRLTWSLPPNSQRDVKQFQVFRRRNIYEPYQLIAMYDFDDSEIKTPYHETPEPFLVQKVAAPVCYFFDKEFTRDTSYIYTLCCIDAHGISSNYSMQLQIAYNKTKNTISQKLISVAGAPKSYPNAFLNEDTFVDTFKTEGYTKMSVYFNPEFLSLTDKEGRDLGLLKTGVEDTYVLQLLNIDLQKQEIVRINVQTRN